MHAGDLASLAEAVRMSYQAQIAEGMEALAAEPAALAWKYCGGGWGGYALYLFADQPARDAFASRPGGVAVEPFLGR